MDASTVVAAAGARPLAMGGEVAGVAVAVVFGLVALLAMRVQFLKVRALAGTGEGGAPDGQTNCPSCGARTSADAEGCAYCGEPLDR